MAPYKHKGEILLVSMDDAKSCYEQFLPVFCLLLTRQCCDKHAKCELVQSVEIITFSSNFHQTKFTLVFAQSGYGSTLQKWVAYPGFANVLPKEPLLQLQMDHTYVSYSPTCAPLHLSSSAPREVGKSDCHMPGFKNQLMCTNVTV
jgi:hypothetical protein